MRIDGFEKVTGATKYADDLIVENTLYACPVHANKPSAKILAINIDKALSTPGIARVITCKDVMGSNLQGGITADHRLFADDRIRYAGDVVALVVANTAAAAKVGASAVTLDLEKLPAAFDPQEALEKNAPLVHPEKKTNICSQYFVKKGDPDKAWKNCQAILETEFSTQFVEHAYMEPESATVVPNADGTITIIACMQHPYSTRKAAAKACALPLAKVRTIQTTVGGGFGGKDDTISYICARAAVAALLCNQPVKCTYTRMQSMLESYKRHPFKMKWKIGADKKGKLQALDAQILADAGAYTSTTPYVIWRPTVQCTGPYLVKNVLGVSRAAFTNNTFTGAMRGFGSPQHVFACESAMDMLAEKLNLDPYEFRRRNFFKNGDTIHTGERLSNHEVSINEVVRTCLKRFGWKEKFAKASRGKCDEHGKYYGVGFAASYRGVSLGAEGSDFCAAVVSVQPDGSAILQAGVAENGQGLKSAMVVILCEAFGIMPQDITYLDVDTSNVPDSCPTVASRGTIMGGSAVIDAANQIKKAMHPAIESLIGKTKKDYEFKRGRIINPTNKKSVSWKDTAAKCYNMRIYPCALGAFKGPSVKWSDEGGFGKAYFTYVYNCQACEIEVDSKTNKVSVKKVVAVHDAGRIINLEEAKGQVYGGIMMGLGFALMEEARHEQGMLQNKGLSSYRLPRTIDMPEMEAIFIENPDDSSPTRAKSLGEPVNELMGAAVANAIYHATGKRFLSLPITPDKIRKALSCR